MNTDDLREEFKGIVSKCLMHTDVGYEYFTDDYVLWLEGQLLIPRFSQQREVLKCRCIKDPLGSGTVLRCCEECDKSGKW